MKARMLIAVQFFLKLKSLFMVGCFIGLNLIFDPNFNP